MINLFKKHPSFLVALSILTIPSTVFAQAPANFPELVGRFVGYMSRITFVLMAVALLVFFWGVAKYILNRGNKESVSKSKDSIGYGIVALFVLASLWGILVFLGNSLGVDLGDSSEVNVNVDDIVPDAN